VTNISDALVLLGLQTVKNITLSLTVMDAFRQASICSSTHFCRHAH